MKLLEGQVPEWSSLSLASSLFPQLGVACEQAPHPTSLLGCSSTTSTSPCVPVSTVLTLHPLQSVPAYSFYLTSIALPQGGHLVHRLRDPVKHLITSKNITPALTAHPHLFLTRKRGCRCSSSRPRPQQ